MYTLQLLLPKGFGDPHEHGLDSVKDVGRKRDALRGTPLQSP